jgi:6-pyruvoyltetrahydropterin/6-carboxytetrahydropterin synthase
MFEITKRFDFCYGHRVWNQTLNREYSLDSCLVCRHLHGHQGEIIVTLRARELEDGMVTDFKHLNFFKKWIDDVLDHKFIMDINDPLKPILFPLAIHLDYIPEDYYIADIENDYPTEIKELYEGVIFVEFVPTSENICKWLYDILIEKLSNLNIVLKSVEFKETPKTSAKYVINNN